MLKCRFGCNRQFRNLADMKAHSVAFHGNRSGSTGPSSRPNSSMKCRYGCNRLFQDLEAMVAHKINFHDSQCVDANGSSNFRASQQRRQVTACNDCGKDFPSVDALRNHQMTQKNHVRLAKAVGSLNCEACPRSLRSQVSLEQHFAAEHMLIKLADEDNERSRLAKNFRTDWRRPSAPGRVLTVYKLYNPGWRVLKFEQYRAPLPNNGNEVQRYHGTSLLCDLGIEPKRSTLCQLEGCNLCGILKSGFKTAKAKIGWQRFGRGIYTTSTSSKSDDYIKSSSSRRAVLVCRVISGKVYRTKINMPTLDSPPLGYNSVSGEVGIDLNYDETVIYQSKAILPAYMIVYTL